ncbi:MAG: histidine kinase [Sulfurimonas sp.]|nr:histidine kinase [Sulfurimonas sp.]
MHNIALHIKMQDWLYILLVGVLFGMSLGALGYSLLGYSLLDGAFFGLLLGFCITLLSLVFITYMNKNILPKVREFFWLPLAIFFSFASGFLGTYLGSLGAEFFALEMIAAFETSRFEIASAIGLLTYIVGALLYRFVKMRNEKELIDHEYVKSRLGSLERQLNPHFLFNALNSIAELIHHNPDKAEMAILKVSAFLRNTMNEQPLLTLSDEIKNVRDYIELENIRFSGKIKLHIDENIPLWRVPKFSIQLLVENAIKHGFVSSSSTLNISIKFEKEGIVVSNDGEAIQSTKFGVGLSNLDQRLKLLCKGYVEIKSKNNPSFYIHIGACCENNNRR